MPHVGASCGAIAHAKSAATAAAPTKSSKPRGESLCTTEEATEAASKAVTSSGDAPADTGASSRRSRSPFVAEGRWPEPALRRSGAQFLAPWLKPGPNTMAATPRRLPASVLPLPSEGWTRVRVLTRK
ncbi:hypothetical protein Pcac1_g24411 [Phytophthora cactorum]|nr:hypothetical protein Pcac1_g24411 [Phytophthora cactorum]